ncbi:MAG: DUF3422 domain-containing protein [Polaromonas sp.]|nr:DUF3422 domain-containing protein [Polaromonas sp.]
MSLISHPLAASPTAWLPPDDTERATLHNEVHARPSARLRLPALIVYVAVLNEGVTREQEWQHLRQLTGQQALPEDALDNNFLRLRFAGFTVKWERHSEFTRLSIVQPLADGALLGQDRPQELGAPVVSAAWLRCIPGRTIAAIELAMVPGDLSDDAQLMQQAQQWFGRSTVVASKLGRGHSWAVTDFRITGNGFERMLVIAPPGTTETRVGRISQRLLELETYRLMALRGLPVAKQLSPMLSEAETALSRITALLEDKSASDQGLLDMLVELAARVERHTAEKIYRFSATRAYYTLVTERIAELREKEIPGTQTIGEFMQRRLSPAMATVAASSQRLGSLSERVSRTSALLRTRVDIATELQNRQLLEKLTRGQQLQLRLQSTVEGLSIAAISYYVISLLLYAGKALKSAGAPIDPEIATGVLIPLVLWVVWRTTRRIHAKLYAEP